MEEGSGAPAARTGRSGIGEEEKPFTDNLGTPDVSKGTPLRTKRSKKGGGCNIRKSIAWNQAFFTEEGVLDQLELSMLSGSLTKPSGNVWPGISGEMSPLAAYNKFSDRPPLHDLEGNNMLGKPGRTQAKDTKAGGLLSKSEASSHEELQAREASGKIPSVKGISRSVPRSPATYSQKRAANTNTVNFTSKIPKFMPAKSQAASPPMASRNVTMMAKNSKSNQSNATVNLEQRIGGYSSNTKKDFGFSSSAHDHVIPKAEKGTTSSKATGPSSSTKLHEPIISAASNKISSLLPHATKHVSGGPPAAGHAKPSALRMPSPSLGFFCEDFFAKPSALWMPSPSLRFFCEGKVSPSYGSQVQRNIQPSQSCIPSIRKPIDLRHKGELRLPPTSVRQPPRGIAATNSSAGAVNSASTKSSSVEANIEMKQLDMMYGRDSITFESCHRRTNSQEQLISNCLSIGDNIDGQSGEISLGTPNPDIIKEAPDSSFSQLNNESLVEVSGVINQFLETNVAVSINEADQSTRDSKKESDSKQLQEGNSGVDNLPKHQHIGNTRTSYAGICESAGNLYCLPDFGPELTAKSTECDASPEAESSFQSSKEQVGGASIVSSFELDNYLSQETGITAQTAIACSTSSSSGLSNRLSEESRSTLSEGRELQSFRLQSESNNVISSMEEKNVLMPEKKALAEKLNPDVCLLKNQLNVLPFSDEWVASLQAFGEDILELKTGPVQNSPPDKALPEPGPWSPVKRKAQDIGPFDCTKYSKNLSTSDSM